MPKALRAIKSIAETFQHDEEVDKAELAKLAQIIKEMPQDYNGHEEDAIRKGKEFYMKCKESDNFDELKSPDDKMILKLVHIDQDSIVTGVVTAVIDAGTEECASFEYIKDSRESLAGLKKRFVVKQHIWALNDHSQLFYSLRSFGF